MALAQELVVLVHEWVTGGGLADTPLPASWQREGSAMRRAIAGEFAALSVGEIKVIMTLDARLPAEAGPWRLELIGPGEHSRKLGELCRAADFTVLVAPETRGILARLTRDLLQAGARVLGSSAQAVELAGDKARLAVLFESLGIATPPSRTIVPSEGLPDLLEYPAVVKPIDGAGSVDTYYLDGPGDLSEEAMRMPQALLQRFVRGEPMSACLLVSPDGRAWPIAIGRQRMQLRNGRLRIRGRRDSGLLSGRRPGSTARWLRSKDSPGLSESISSGMVPAGSPQFSRSTRAPPHQWSGYAGCCRRAVWPGRGSKCSGRRLETTTCSKVSVRLVHTWKPVVFDTSGDFVDVSDARTS